MKSFLDISFALSTTANTFLILIEIIFLVSETIINLFNTFSLKFSNLPISLNSCNLPISPLLS